MKAGHSIEFEVIYSNEEAGYSILDGRCIKGPIKIGHRFDRLIRYRIFLEDNEVFNLGPEPIADINLCVEKIIIYGREMEILYPGMTGRLILAGDSAAQIQPRLVIWGE